MAKKVSSRNGSGWRRIAGEPAKLGPLLRDAGVVACDEDPAEVTAFYDRAQRLRRVTARYANGWRCAMTLRGDGSYTLSQSLSMRVTGVKAPTA